jgi:hypothetical protein
MSTVGIFSGGTTATIDDGITAVLLTVGRDARRAVARAQLTIREQVPQQLRAVAADEFTGELVLALGEERLVLWRNGGRTLLRAFDLAGLSSVFVESSALGGFTASIGGTGVLLRMRARATAERLRAVVNEGIVANRPRTIPELFPVYFTSLLGEAGVAATPVNVARLVERTAFMLGCQGAAYCAQLGDPRGFEELVRQFARGGPLERRMHLADDLVDWLWTWNPGCHDDLPLRVARWRDGLLRPGSFLVRGRDVPPFDETADADNTAAFRAVFAKNC